MALISMSRFANSRRLATVFVAATLSLSGSLVQADGLLDVYNLAKTYDADLKAAEFDFEATRNAVRITKADNRLQAALGASASIGDVNDDGDGSFTSQALSLSLRQTLFNSAQSIAIDQSRLAVTQAEAQLESQRQSLILRVATAYFDVLRAQAVVAFRRSELDAIGRQKEQNERRFDVGLVPVTDVKNAQAQFDLATAAEIAAVNQLSAAEEALIVVSGADPKLLAELREDMPLVSPDPSDIKAWVKISEEQNIPLIVAKLAAESAKQGIAANRALRMPTLDLVGSASSSETEQLGRPDVDRAEIGLELSVPLLTGGRTNALVAQARANSLASNERLVSQRRATVQQARNAYRNVLASISRVNALRQALESTQKSLEAQEAGFAEGLLTSLEVLRSLRDTFSAQSDYAAARYDYILSTLQLKQVAGILTEADLTEIDQWLIEDNS